MPKKTTRVRYYLVATGVCTWMDTDPDRISFVGLQERSWELGSFVMIDHEQHAATGILDIHTIGAEVVS
jgi:hypothetical protein